MTRTALVLIAALATATLAGPSLAHPGHGQALHGPHNVAAADNSQADANTAAGQAHGDSKAGQAHGDSGGAHGGSESEAPPLLNVTPGQYFWTLLLFLALLLVLAKFVWPHVLKTLQDREAKIRDDLTEAERANKEAQQTLEQYKKQLADAQKESQQIIEQSRTEAQQLAEQWKNETRQELQQMRQRAEQEIQAAKEQAVSDLYEQAATLSTDVAGRILQREISEADQKELIEQSLRDLEKSQKIKSH
jgi:F-type H+-transporting ATPase subunit b